MLSCPILPQYPFSSLVTNLFFSSVIQISSTISAHSHIPFNFLTYNLLLKLLYHHHSTVTFLAHIHINHIPKSDKHFVSTLQYCHWLLPFSLKFFSWLLWQHTCFLWLSSFLLTHCFEPPLLDSIFPAIALIFLILACFSYSTHTLRKNSSTSNNNAGSTSSPSDF